MITSGLLCGKEIEDLRVRGKGEKAGEKGVKN
jgi:hypothetical protein